MMANNGLIENRRDGRMVQVGGIFFDREKADAAIANYRENYHPEGYGTALRLTPSTVNQGMFIVEGYRYASCD